MTGAILQKSGQGAACGGAAGASSVIRLRSRAASRPTPWRFYRLLGKAAGEGARRRGSGRGSRAFAKRAKRRALTQVRAVPGFTGWGDIVGRAKAIKLKMRLCV